MINVMGTPGALVSSKMLKQNCLLYSYCNPSIRTGSLGDVAKLYNKFVRPVSAVILTSLLRILIEQQRRQLVVRTYSKWYYTRS